MQKNKIFGAGLIILILMAGFSVRGAEQKEWSRIVIQEAFVSRQTSIDFRDTNSAPEFGWHIRHNNTFITKTGSLYATMYVPFGVNEPVRLMLVEVDAFSDDIVSGVDLEKDKKKYVLNSNGDFVVLERSPFFPDARSGADASPEGAVLVKADRTDSLSFLDGDYTDCCRLPQGPVSLLLIAGSYFGGIDTAGESDIAVHPGKPTMNKVHIVHSAHSGGVVRLRGQVGVGTVPYQVLHASGTNHFNLLFEKALAWLEKQDTDPSYFFYKEMAEAFVSLDRARSMEASREGPGLSPSPRATRFREALRKACQM